MKLDKINSNKIRLEISSLSSEKILNTLWKRNINIINVKKVSITTMIITVDYIHYNEIEEIVKKSKGKVKILGKSGLLFFLERLRKEINLILGGIFFLIVLYILSTYIWGIEIKTGESLPPYEIRSQLSELGVKPGIAKKDLNVYELEKKIMNINDNILWIRARIEGSILRVSIEEKVDPPTISSEENINDCIAKMYGEIKRVFVTNGTANVEVGDIVNEGDVLIKGVQGKEESEYKFETPAKGTVIANTFYEKEMEIQVKGSKLVKTGDKSKEIYLNIFGRKIYIKKDINKFKYYDKIEVNNWFVNTITYFEKEEQKINADIQVEIDKAANKLEQSLLKDLTNDAKIVDKKVETEDVDGERIRVKVNFVVEQDIAQETTY